MLEHPVTETIEIDDINYEVDFFFQKGYSGSWDEPPMDDLYEILDIRCVEEDLEDDFEDIITHDDVIWKDDVFDKVVSALEKLRADI